MKTYEKPVLMALSLGGNDRLCGECKDNNAYLLYQDPTGETAQKIDWYYGNRDGEITKQEVANIFGYGDHCNDIVSLAYYCKYAGVNPIAWS